MKRKLFALLMGAVLLGGCAGSVMPTGYLNHPESSSRAGMNIVWTASDVQLSSYNNILVKKFETDATVPNHPNINARSKSSLFQTELISYLNREGKNATDDEIDLPVGSAYLEVDGVIAQLNPGNRTLRYMIGFGAGRSLVEIEARVNKIQAGGVNECAEFGVGKSKFMGIWGGSSDKFIDDGIRDIATLIGKFICGD